MFKRIIFNLIVALILIMIGAAIIKANKARLNSLFSKRACLEVRRTEGSDEILRRSAPQDDGRGGSSARHLIPKEAKYYRVIEE